MRSEYAGSRVGPILQTNIPPAAPPEHLAASIVWLLSDESTNINGVVLPNDGGWSTV
jgi:NAD(P)-dependent dehydrogenase (short-subunit alcohol dehydrogenase family)